MSRTLWVSRDAEGQVIGTTEVRRTSGCSGCLTFGLILFVIAAPAAWAGSGDIPLAVAVLMYIVEAALVVGVVLKATRAARSGPPKP